MEKKLKHLDMIESVIQRMGNNSFQLKGWAVTLVAIIGGLSSQGDDKRFFIIAFIPLIAFWVLDSYYLQLERKYKIMYRNVACKDENQIDFNMDTNNIEYNNDDNERVCFWNCLFSATEYTFYLIIAGAVGLLAVVLLTS